MKVVVSRFAKRVVAKPVPVEDEPGHAGMSTAECGAIRLGMAAWNERIAHATPDLETPPRRPGLPRHS